MSKKKIDPVSLNFDFKMLKEDAEKESGNRKFKGVAYSGAVIPQHGWVKNLVIDLENIKFKKKIPMFFNHSSDKPVGFATMESDGKELTIQGEVIPFFEGEKVIQMAEAGFDWELSVGVSSESMYEMGEKEERKVNGLKLKGSHYILHGNTVKETSFVPIGADSNTSSSFLSKVFGKKDSMIEIQLTKKEITNEITNEKEVQQMEALQKKYDDLVLSSKELEAKLAVFETEKKEIELKSKTEKIEARLLDYDLSEDDSTVLKSIFLSEDEEKNQLAEMILNMKSKKVEPKKVELSKELFVEKKTVAAPDTSSKSLREIALGLKKENPTWSMSRSLIEAASKR